MEFIREGYYDDIFPNDFNRENSFPIINIFDSKKLSYDDYDIKIDDFKMEKECNSSSTINSKNDLKVFEIEKIKKKEEQQLTYFKHSSTNFTEKVALNLNYYKELKQLNFKEKLERKKARTKLLLNKTKRKEEHNTKKKQIIEKQDNKKLRNRLAAQRSRINKKIQNEIMKENIDFLEKRNETLQNELLELRLNLMKINDISKTLCGSCRQKVHPVTYSIVSNPINTPFVTRNKIGYVTGFIAILCLISLIFVPSSNDYYRPSRMMMQLDLGDNFATSYNNNNIEINSDNIAVQTINARENKEEGIMQNTNNDDNETEPAILHIKKVSYNKNNPLLGFIKPLEKCYPMCEIEKTPSFLGLK